MGQFPAPPAEGRGPAARPAPVRPPRPGNRPRPPSPLPAAWGDNREGTGSRGALGALEIGAQGDHGGMGPVRYAAARRASPAVFHSLSPAISRALTITGAGAPAGGG